MCDGRRRGCDRAVRRRRTALLRPTRRLERTKSREPPPPPPPPDNPALRPRSLSAAATAAPTETNRTHFVSDAAFLAAVPLTAAATAAPIEQTHTQCVAYWTNETLGGLLNATFGNATEMIVSYFALRDGLVSVVKVGLSLARAAPYDGDTASW